MCSAPDVPAPVSRQETKMPERPASGRSMDESKRRRRGYAALLASTPAGAMTRPNTTATAGGAATLGG